MIRKVDDFVEDWTQESEGTLKYLRALTDASLEQRVGPEGRSLGRLAWHITQSIPEMMSRTGLNVVGAPEDAPVPPTAAEIVAEYEKVSRALLEELPGRWTDDTLLESSDMYGEQWVNGTTLDILIRHQTHHRAQMSVLMRQAGLKVPGVYGPSREEWTIYGMQPQE